MHMTSKLVIYTDGSSLNNQGDNSIAGVGVYFGDNDSRNYSEPLGPLLDEIGVDGVMVKQTNQQAEMMAIVKAIEICLHDRAFPPPLEIRTDSSYCLLGITKWIENWKKNGWKTSNNKDVKNKQLWIKMNELVDKYPQKIDFVKVKGHSDDYGNQMADKLATSAAKRNSRT